MVFEEITKYAKPAAFMLAGATAFYVGSTPALSKSKGIIYPIGGALAAYGLYSLYSMNKPEQEEPVLTDGELVPTITDPSFNEDWSLLRVHSVNYRVKNNTGKLKSATLVVLATDPNLKTYTLSSEFIRVEHYGVYENWVTFPPGYPYYPTFFSTAGRWSVGAFIYDKIGGSMFDFNIVDFTLSYL